LAAAGELGGEVLLPGTPSYTQARPVWNAMFDSYEPAAIVRCRSEADVARTVRVLSQVDGLGVAVRGGGHHIGGFGTCHGGVVIDLHHMRGVAVANDHAHVRVQGGATLGDVDTATAAFGRAVPLGVVSLTGVGGLTLSGGVGWLTRRLGYTCDNVVAARVVTASGEIVAASADSEPDLLWGLRGGGGNFGVVTEFTFQTHPVDPVLVATAVHVVDRDEERTDSVLRWYRDWTATLADEATVWLLIEHADAAYSMLPEDDQGGRLAVAILACWSGPEDEGRRVLAPLLGDGKPEFSSAEMMRLVDLQRTSDARPSAQSGFHNYMKGEMVTELTERAIDGIRHYGHRLPNETSRFEAGQMGGAMGRRDEMDAAVGLRAAQHLIGFETMRPDGAGVQEDIAWTREAWSTLTDASAGGVYLNFSGDESLERVMTSLGAGAALRKRRKLVELKRRIDPDNFFKINHNIDPDAPVEGEPPAADAARA
jgi:FAD/FMN-containing dehydrogenase